MSLLETYAQARDSQIALRVRYNEILLRLRELEAYLDNDTLPREDREAKIPEYKALCRTLVGLLEEIPGHTMEEVGEGFRVTSVNSVDSDYRRTA